MTISHKIPIQYKDEKAITVPSDMVMKHGEDDYIRLRPTNYAIIQLICGSSACNASISSSGKLHELIRMRNDQLMEHHEHEDSHEALFASSEPEPSSSAKEAPLKRKRTMKILPETINIMVKGVQVQCLVHGRRPSASDLAIRMDAQQIEAVVEYMREDAIEAMQASRGSTSRRRGLDSIRKTMEPACMQGFLEKYAVHAMQQHAHAGFMIGMRVLSHAACPCRCCFLCLCSFSCLVAIHRQAHPFLISSMAVPEGVVCEVEAIMASTLPLNTKTDHILHVLMDAGLAHHQKLQPRSCLIHPENRAQSMLSFHDVWMEGASMSMVGFNQKLVDGNTIAFAMSTDPSRRATQIEKNKALIEQSGGHLAPINGQEGQSPMSNPKPHVYSF